MFRLLGPLEARVGGLPVPLGGPKPRMLLATLLLEPNVTVPRDHLVEVLWPGEQPRSAAANIRTYVHFLRRCLGGRIERKAGGYVLEAEPDELDTAVFEDRVAEAQRALASDDRTRALLLLGEAGSLWHGDPLSDLPHSHLWGPALARLGELRLSTQELRLGIGIELGEYTDAIAELRGLLTTHPLREELWLRLVQALDGAGRTAEARSAYAEAEQVLHDELGAEPGPRLRAIREHIGTSRAAPASATPPAYQLPHDLPDFTGRTDCLADLVELIRHRRANGQPGVVVFSGPPGVGKTSVAVHLAHAVREEFPDGQLHVDLGGAGPQRREPSAVLAELLRSLGVQDAVLPQEETERAALLRSRLATARLCLVLDDAADAAQVRPLLPGAGTCTVLVTSRTRLPALTGARPVPVDVLPSGDALRLLTWLSGTRRVREEPEAADAIVRACGRLPLAIRVAGARLAHRPAWTLAMFADRLADERHRLDELRAGDLAVRASVALSYDQLPATAATAFARLGLLGGVQFPSWVVAALLGPSCAEDAGSVLELLVDTHLAELVSSDGTGHPRHRLHDLLRCYAVERAEESDRDTRDAAVRRVVETYLGLALDAVARMPVRFFGVLPDPRDGRRPAHAETLIADPVAWFESEHRTLVAMVELADERGFDDLTWRLACALLPYFDLRDHWADWASTHELALAAARRAGAGRGEAMVLRNLGQLAVYRDDFAAALAAYRRAYAITTRLGDDRDTAVVLTGTNTVHRLLGELDDALDCCHEALRLFVALGDVAGEAVVRISIGSAWLARGDATAADRWFSEGRALAASIGDTHREAHALHRQAVLYRGEGSLAAAREQLDHAIALFLELGDEHCAGYAQQSLGELYLASGDLAHARLLLVNSLAIHHATGDRRSAAEASERLGTLHESLGQPEAALEHLENALVLWRQLGETGRELDLVERVRHDRSRRA